MSAEHSRGSLSALLSLAGQSALVTGASGNIGRGIAERLAEAGAGILVHYCTDVAAAEETVARIRSMGGHATAVRGDLSDNASIDSMFAQFDREGVLVTRLVNNAGTYGVQDLEGLSGDEWKASLRANLDSAFLTGQAAARRMIDNNIGGAIVNIASIEGSDPAAGHAHYASAKAGLLMLTRACALEYGARGIRCNAVSPGLIERPGIADNWPDGVARWRDKAPLQRLGRVEDVANAVLYLLSDAASWVSGAEIKVDGGMSAVSRW